MTDNRKLGRTEQVMEQVNRRAKTWNIVTISRIKGSLSAEILRPALDMIQHRHPRLNSRIVYYRNSLYFQTEGTTQIPLRIIRNFDDEQWEEIVREEMNLEIDSSKCLLRAVLVHIHSQSSVNYLITTVHHAVGDGLSSVQLHSEILTYCHKIVSGDSIHPVHSLFPLAPIEELLPPQTKGLKGKISSILFLLRLGLKKLFFNPKTLGNEKYVPIEQRYSNIIHRELEPQITQHLVNCCRQQKTTVNSALCAAMMLAVASKVEKVSRNKICMNSLLAVDLRKRLETPISNHHMAVLVSNIIGFHTLKANKSFWELAREVKQTVETSIKRGDIFKTILVAQHMINFCFTYPQQLVGTVLLSNIGQVNIPEVYGKFELEEISFASSQSLYTGMFMSHTATFRGKMLLNFVFSEPSISRDNMEEIVNNCMLYLIHVCQFNIEDTLMIV